MALTVWQILTPNLTLTTVIGILVFLLGLFSVITPGLRTLTTLLGKPLEWLIPGDRELKGNWMGWLLMILGLFLVFGVSALQNIARSLWEFFQTTEGIITAIAVVAVVAGYFIIIGRNGGKEPSIQPSKLKLR